jgi:hypothetical protein
MLSRETPAIALAVLRNRVEKYGSWQDFVA